MIAFIFRIMPRHQSSPRTTLCPVTMFLERPARMVAGQLWSM